MVSQAHDKKLENLPVTYSPLVELELEALLARRHPWLRIGWLDKVES
jgi:hypothetical protein